MKVGIEVVALINHPQRLYVKDAIYLILGVRRGSCLCNGVEIDIGVSFTYSHVRCSECDMVVSADPTGIFWENSSNFAPLDSDEEIQEALNEALKESFLEIENI